MLLVLILLLIQNTESYFGMHPIRFLLYAYLSGRYKNPTESSCKVSYGRIWG